MTTCDYCKREYTNPPETCAGCGAAVRQSKSVSPFDKGIGFLSGMLGDPIFVPTTLFDPAVFSAEDIHNFQPEGIIRAREYYALGAMRQCVGAQIANRGRE